MTPILQFNLEDSKQCPCGSGMIVRDCLVSSGRVHPPSVAPIPPSSPTNAIVNRCYAAPLHDCGGKLSREHVLSASVLKKLDAPSPHFSVVSQHPLYFGIDGLFGPKLLPIQALASKVLCERHNRSLSGLDLVGLRLCNALETAASYQTSNNAVFLLNGSDVERWLLKTLCGLMASGWLDKDANQDPAIFRTWVDALFGYRELTLSEGLYVRVDVEVEGPQKGIQVNLIREQTTRRVYGIRVSLYAVELLLLLHPSGIPRTGDTFPQRRPVALHFSKDTDSWLGFTWPSGTGTAPLELRGGSLRKQSSHGPSG